MRVEGPVVGNDIVGVDRRRSHRGVEDLVAANSGGDVRRQPGADRLGDEQPAEAVRRERQRLVAHVGGRGCGERPDQRRAGAAARTGLRNVASHFGRDGSRHRVRQDPAANTGGALGWRGD